MAHPLRSSAAFRYVGWLCKGEWSKHGANSGGYYACNRYEAAKSSAGSNVSAEEQNAADAKAKLERYQVRQTETRTASATLEHCKQS